MPGTAFVLLQMARKEHRCGNEKQIPFGNDKGRAVVVVENVGIRNDRRLLNV